MADIDQILAGGAGASSRADFSGIADIPKAYWEGKDQRAKNDLRDAFKGGVPLDASGQPDFGAMAKTLFQKGGLEQGVAASNLGIARDQLRFGQGQSADIGNFERGQPTQAPSQPIVGPSVNRNSVSPDPGQRADASTQPSPQAAKPPATVMTVLAAQGIPNDQLQAASASVARQLGVDPTAPLNMDDPQVRNVLTPAVAQLKRQGIGQVVPEGQPSPPPQVIPQQPQAAPQQPQPAPVTNAVTTTQAPQVPSRVDQAIAFYSGIMSDPRSPKQNVELAKERLGALQKSNELTPLQKEYAQGVLQGFKGTFEDWQNRTDDNTTKRDILTKSLLPKVDKSQESATAARDDIDAIHRAREELDQKGGVFSGAFADKMLYLAKVGEVLGIPNADKIKNTESYGAAIGQRVAVMVKAFGSGTAISDGDRRFAAAMAGGQVTLDENSMRRILDIGEKANRGKINNHNKLVDEIVGSNEGLKDAKKSYMVAAPGEYKKPAADVFGAARDAIAKGAPRDAVMKRLRENGHDPAKL